MKKCANCGFENSDDATSCHSCNTETFVSSSPDAIGGHIISPEEQSFWQRMTFRQFAVFLIRLQALWFIFMGIIYASYLPDYFSPYSHLTFFALLAFLRVVFHFAFALVCIKYADRIVSWFVKDSIPRQPPNTALEPTATAPSDSTDK
jgi:hypothetical protein